MRRTSQPWQNVAQILQDEYVLGAAYFMPSERFEAPEELKVFEVGDLYEAPRIRFREPGYRVHRLDEEEVLNIYEAPGSDRKCLAALPYNAQSLYITGPSRRKDDVIWVPISWGTLSGWVDKAYLREEDESAGRWNEADLFVIPLTNSADQPIGLISLDAPNDDRRPDLNAAKVLEIFANHAAVAIENHRLFHRTRDHAEQLQQLHQKTQQQLAELQTVNTVSQVISATLDLNQLMEKVGGALSTAFKVDSYYIALYSPEDDRLRFRLVVDHGRPLKRKSQRADHGPTNQIFRLGQPLLIEQK
jgi:transcriptional regulator with GAF, ATPase, and Fis domain